MWQHIEIGKVKVSLLKRGILIHSIIDHAPIGLVISTKKDRMIFQLTFPIHL